MITRTYPYDQLSILGFAKMKGYKINNITLLYDKTPPKLLDIIIKCLNPNPELRCDLN